MYRIIWHARRNTTSERWERIDARVTDDVDMVCEHLFDAEDANRGVGWRKYRVTVVTLI